MTAFQRKVQRIELNPSVQQALGKHLLSSYPHEACGILLGAAAAGGMLIDTYVPIRNVAPDPLHSFVPDPEEWVKALYSEPAPVGLFHSHPQSPPRPSIADLDGLKALGPEFLVYLIGSPGSESESSPHLNGYYIHRQRTLDGILTFELIQTPIHVLLK